MVEVFKNKFFIISIVIAIILTVTAMTLNIIGKGNIVSDVVNTIVQPFQMFANVLKDSLSGFTTYFTEFNNLKKENAELKAQVESLEKELSAMGDYKEKYEVLLPYLDIKQEHIDYELQPATIIAREAENYMSILTIDKGSLHEIEKDMPVITSDGVVGYISEVGLWTSKVVLFTRTSVSISAYINRTGITGMAEGDFEAEKKGLCKLTYLPKDVDLILGDTIISSGYGGLFPAGLTIGKVVEIEANEFTHTLDAYIEPAVDLDSIRYVMIIRSSERKFE